MFTGIITDVGELVTRDRGVFSIRCGYDARTIELGASIACNGCCLTVTSLTPEPEGCIFTVDVSNETLAMTTLGDWPSGHRINLERALRAGDELGGHIVSGHVDGVAELTDVQPDGDSRRFTFAAPKELAKFIAPKGSVALDGTSLTVNEVEAASFGINLIPHTLTATTWGGKKPGDLINLEIDLFARYVARMMEFNDVGSGS